jgi:hypothetical protein
MPQRAWESRPSTAPSTPRRCATLCGMVSNHCDTVPPTRVRLAHRTLEKGRKNPRREDTRLLHARTGRRRDVRPVGAVTSVAIGPVRPSRPLHHHPRRCGSMWRQGTATPATVPCTASCQWHPRVLTRTALERATSTPPPSKLLLEAHRTRHDAPPEARFARTAVYSMALYDMPPHVALGPQSVPLGPGGPASSPASLVAPLYKHHSATQYSAPSTPLLDVRPRPEPG